MAPPTARKPNPPQRSPTAANFAGATRFDTSEFPPPPRRPPPPRTKTTFASSTPGGSESNWQYTKAKPSNNAKTSEEEAQEKLNKFKAWDQMRSNPRTPRFPPDYAGRGTGNSFGEQQSPPKTRTAWETETPKTKPGRVPRRQGFAPSNPAGDEPQARHSSAYHNVSSNGERPGVPKAQSGFMPPPPGPPPLRKGDPLRAFKTQAGIDDTNSERVSTPYATVGGERTYFSSAGLGRSASTRTSNHPAYEDGRSHMKSPSAYPGRHNSASPKLSSPRPEQSRCYSSTSSEDSDIYNRSSRKTRSRGGNTTHSPLAPQRPASKSPFRGYRDDERLKPQPPMFRSPFPGSHEERTNTNNSWAEDVQKQESSDPQRRSSSGHTEGFLNHRLNRSGQYSQPQSPRYRPEPSTNGGSPLHHQKPPVRPKSWHEKNHSSDGVRVNSGEPKTKPSMYDSSTSTFTPVHNNLLSNKWSEEWPFGGPKRPRNSSERPPYWAIPSSVAPKTSQSLCWGSIPVPSSLADRFDSFTFPIDDSTFKKGPPLKSQSSENIDINFSPSDKEVRFTGNQEYFPERSNGDGVKSTNPPHIPPPPNSYPPDPKKLSPEDWSKHFRPTTWGHPSPPHSPIRTSTITSTKRPKPTRKTSRATKRPTIPRPASVATAVDDADDDEDPLSNETFASAKSTVSSTSSNAMDIDPALGGVPAPETKKSSLDLSDLKNVTPLASSNDGGLQNLNDLSSTLPFKSRASDSNPGLGISQPLDLPKPPKAIAPPENITQTASDRYLAQIVVYMYEWNAFNDKMLAHFNARQAEVRSFEKDKWMSGIGDDIYNRYMRGLQDDVRVRTHWDVSWEKHTECMKGLGAIRAKMKGGTKT